MKKLLAVLLAIAFITGACGSDSGGSGANEELVAALADELLSDDSPMSESEATCAAENIVGDIGEDRLTELGVTADDVSSVEDIDFTEDELNAVVDGLTDCFDLQAVMAEEFASDGTFSEEDAECIAAELGDDQLKTAMRVGFTGESDPEAEAEFQAAIIDAFGACDVVPG